MKRIKHFDPYQIALIKEKLNVDLDVENIKRDNLEKKLNNVIKLSERNEKNLRWFNLPYRINGDSKSHQELIKMLRKIIR